MTVRELCTFLQGLISEDPAIADYCVVVMRDPEGNGCGAVAGEPGSASEYHPGLSLEHYTQRGWRSGSIDDPGDPNALVLWPMV